MGYHTFYLFETNRSICGADYALLSNGYQLLPFFNKCPFFLDISGHLFLLTDNFIVTKKSKLFWPETIRIFMQRLDP